MGSDRTPVQLRKAGYAKEVQGPRLYGKVQAEASATGLSLTVPCHLACRAIFVELLSLMQPQAFYRVVAEDFTAVDGIIRRQLTSRVPLVEKIGDYIISAGGKRLRPLLVLLAGKTLGYKGDDLCLLAATIEFLHTSTLLHDDVVDASGLRRGRSTANALWGNAPSVLVGDFLYARSFEMMVELGSMPVMRIISQATRVIAEGEVLQLSKVRDASTTEETYMEVIRGKTAMLSRPRPTAPPRCARPARNSPRHCAASATTWESPSSWWTTCSTTAATPRPSARTSATTSPKASPPCR